jgi:hypothetical protein
MACRSLYVDGMHRTLVNRSTSRVAIDHVWEDRRFLKPFHPYDILPVSLQETSP